VYLPGYDAALVFRWLPALTASELQALVQQIA